MLPKIVKIKQRFPRTSLKDIPGEVIKQMSIIKDKIKPGMEIGIGVGSRGIANIDIITKTVVNTVKALGGIPFIIPAMGSHGGATAKGQEMVLAKLGITRETVGAEIRSSMEVAEIGLTPSGVKVYQAKDAVNADGLIIINRIKPHTDFEGDIQSGLCKMIAVGLGKEKGCTTMHLYGLRETIPEAAQVAINKLNFFLGLGIIENQADETMEIIGVKPEKIVSIEKELLRKARQVMARLPFDKIDVLVVREMGKNFSGTGIDTKVIGRMYIRGEKEPEYPSIKKIVVLDLSDDSYGNALGIGLADITTKRLVSKIDFNAMNPNVIATSFLERGKIPIAVESDREAIITAIKTCGPIPLEDLRLLIIDNTLHLEELYASEGFKKELSIREDLVILDQWQELHFTEDGELMM